MDLKIYDKVLYKWRVGKIIAFDYDYKSVQLGCVHDYSYNMSFSTSWIPTDDLIPVVPMPLDEKHISSDWINDSFFDVCVENPSNNIKHDEYVGFRNGLVYKCTVSCNENFVNIELLQLKEKYKSIKDLDEYFKDMNNCLCSQGICCSVEFIEHNGDFFKCMVSFYAKAI